MQNLQPNRKISPKIEKASQTPELVCPNGCNATISFTYDWDRPLKGRKPNLLTATCNDCGTIIPINRNLRIMPHERSR